MNAHRRRAASGVVLVVGIAATFAAALAPAQILVPGKDPKFPRARYADSLISLNDRCLIRHGILNPAFKPVYVNGRPIGFC